MNLLEDIFHLALFEFRVDLSHTNTNLAFQKAYVLVALSKGSQILNEEFCGSLKGWMRSHEDKLGPFHLLLQFKVIKCIRKLFVEAFAVGET